MKTKLRLAVILTAFIGAITGAMPIESWASDSQTDEPLLKDPRTRDEDISHLIIKVHTERKNGLYYYYYAFFSPLENKGKASSFTLDISCDLDFSQVAYPSVEPIDDFSIGKHVPVGNVHLARPHHAMFGLLIKPGEGTIGVLTSPAPPIDRDYTVSVSMDDDGWDYETYGGKEAYDFMLQGKILGPECTTEFAPEIAYLGAAEEPFGANKLLAYAEPTTGELVLNDTGDSVTITLFYDKGIDPNTFKAKLDGKDISSLFNPVADSYETVTVTGDWKTNSRIHLSILGNIDDKDKGNNNFKTIDNDVFKIKVK